MTTKALDKHNGVLTYVVRAPHQPDRVRVVVGLVHAALQNVCLKRRAVGTSA